MKYVCSKTSCTASFSAHNTSIIEQLPMDLQMEFPAIFTHKLGVSKTLADLLRPCIQNSVGPARFEALLTELHHLRHDRLELQYLLNCQKRRSGIARFTNLLPTAPFSAFDDQKKYAGYVPTEGYIRSLYTSLIEELRPQNG